MNNSSSFISAFLRHVRLFSNNDPSRDWLFLLISSIIILLSIVVWNVWAFDTVANGGTIGTASTSITPIFDQASLETIHTIFAERAAEEGKYASGVYRYTDPSQ